MARLHIFKNNPQLRQELISLYTSTDMTMTELAKHFGVDRHTISKALRDFNVVIKNKNVGVKNNKYIDVNSNRILELYNDNISISQIAKRMKVDRSVIELRLIKNGIDLTDIRRPKKYNGKNSCYFKLYNKYKFNALQRGYEFSISEEKFFKLVQGDCFYCGSNPSKTVKNNDNETLYNGIDRYDNSIGYTDENCVTCCWICNRFKQTMTHKELKEHVAKMYNHLILQN